MVAKRLKYRHVFSKENYLKFVSKVRRASWRGRCTIGGRPMTLNYAQNDEMKMGTEFIVARLRTRTNRIRLLISAHTFYLLGFRSSSRKTWYSFTNKNKEEYCNVIDGAKPLNFGDTYGEIGGLPDARISFSIIENAINHLDKSDSRNTFKEPLRALIIFVCESARFDTICNGIGDLLESGNTLASMPANWVDIMKNWEYASTKLVKKGLPSANRQIQEARVEDAGGDVHGRGGVKRGGRRRGRTARASSTAPVRRISVTNMNLGYIAGDEEGETDSDFDDPEHDVDEWPELPDPVALLEAYEDHGGLAVLLHSAVVKALEREL